MWIINGFIGAIETVKPRRRCFTAGAPVTKKCWEMVPSEKEFTFYLNRF
jgi:hypothetical protein